MAHSALSVAKYFLAIPDEDSGELVSNLKLQKLLYYAQGFHVALLGINQPLFNDTVYAWKHGPVIKSVYNHYSKYGPQALPSEKVPAVFSQSTIQLLDEVYRVFGRYSAWALREMTHREDPWQKNFDPDRKNVEIPLKDLRTFFLKHVKKT